jgi:hypothetical protein
MLLEVTDGPPVLTINNGYTFLVSELTFLFRHQAPCGEGAN